MLKRAFTHLSLVLLFAFTQMGVVTHAISHIGDNHSHQKQEQNNTENQCGQCLSLSHVENANLTPIFDFELTPSDNTFAVSTLPSFTSSATTFYSARAPPNHSQV